MSDHHWSLDQSGILLLNKPYGMSSNKALQKVRTFLGKKKAGFLGTLDPLATGMLPICYGQSRRLIEYVLYAQKVYEVDITFGVQTTTGDREGEVIAEGKVPDLTLEMWQNELDAWQGRVVQKPSMYSAIKIQGRPSYAWARSGHMVEIPERTIELYDCKALSFTAPTLQMRVLCSGGTYIRTLAEDIAKKMGTVAYVTKLHRTGVYPFLDHAMQTLEDLSMHQCLRLDHLVVDHPTLILSSFEVLDVINGRRPYVEAKDVALTSIYDEDGLFLGVGKIQGGVFIPIKVMHWSNAQSD